MPLNFRQMLVNILIVMISIVLTLGMIEIVLRVGFPPDEDGMIHLFGNSYNLRLRDAQIINMDRQLAHFAGAPKSYFLYDEYLGWVHRPDSHWNNGIETNGQALRSNINYTPEPIPGVLRIAIFGDSFAEGLEVTGSESWAYRLQDELAERGIPNEVLNFGISAYGIDQSYWRWKYDGQQMQPHLVIFALNESHMFDTLNIMRPNFGYGMNGPIFSKPRFVQRGDFLTLVNQPPIPPNQLLETFLDDDLNGLARYERYHTVHFPTRLQNVVWLATREYPHVRQLRPGHPAVTLSDTIITQFANEVTATGSQFMLAYQPTPSEMWYKITGQPYGYEQVIDSLASRFDFVSPLDALMDIPWDDMWMPLSHYTPLANAVVAEVFAEKISVCVLSPGCTFGGYEFLPDQEIAYAHLPELKGLFYVFNNPESIANPDFALRVWRTEGIDGLAVAGDWDGDGLDTVGVYNPTTGEFFMDQDNRGQSEPQRAIYTPVETGGIPLMGDFDGDGVDTLAIYDPIESTFYFGGIINGGTVNTIQAVSITLPDGSTGRPVTGDWNGDGVDTMGLYDYRNATFYLYNNAEGGTPDQTIQHGPGESPVYYPLAGNWSGGNASSVGIYSQYSSYADLLHEGGRHVEVDFNYSSRTVQLVAGDWDGDGVDTLAAFIE